MDKKINGRSLIWDELDKYKSQYSHSLPDIVKENITGLEVEPEVRNVNKKGESYTWFNDPLNPTDTELMQLKHADTDLWREWQNGRNMFDDYLSDYSGV